MHPLDAGAGMVTARSRRGRIMTSDDMPDWARDMHLMIQILVDQVRTLEFQMEERRTAEILDPRPQAIAEKAERTAKAARDIADATSNLTHTLVRSLLEEQNRTAKQRERTTELERRLVAVEQRLNTLNTPPADKPDLRW
jgi:polyhydroxyalkanoate synthesis regulator phasin